MTQKITKADLQGMLGRLERNLKRHRLIITGDVLTLTTGSKLYGNSYQVEAIRYADLWPAPVPGTGTPHPFALGGY